MEDFQGLLILKILGYFSSDCAQACVDRGKARTAGQTEGQKQDKGDVRDALGLPPLHCGLFCAPLANKIGPQSYNPEQKHICVESWSEEVTFQSERKRTFQRQIFCTSLFCSTNRAKVFTCYRGIYLMISIAV